MKKIDWKTTKNKTKRFFFGMSITDGFLYKLIIYILLISFGYIYLYPILFMTMNSLMSVEDLINPGVSWIPTTFEWSNYTRSFEVLEIPQAIWESTSFVFWNSVAATLSAMLIGYGFARFEFPLKKLLFVLMLATFILPQAVTLMSNVLIYTNLGIMSTKWAMLLPAMSGQGLNAAIYILIFYSFYKTIPHVLFESAEVDGAGPLRIFFKIAIPLVLPAFLIVFLFSFVWYWNETYITPLFAGGNITLPTKLIAFQNSYETLFPPDSPGNELNEAIRLAGNMITILPLLVLYFIAQRYFVESIDRSGITGE